MNLILIDKTHVRVKTLNKSQDQILFSIQKQIQATFQLMNSTSTPHSQQAHNHNPNPNWSKACSSKTPLH